LSGVNVIMASALWRDLNARGAKQFNLADCEAMVACMFDCALTIEIDTRPARRCETGETENGLCPNCRAVGDEDCRKPRKGRQ
jgi:hypothetical protein